MVGLGWMVGQSDFCSDFRENQSEEQSDSFRSVIHSMFFQKSNDLLNIMANSVDRSMFFQKSNDLLNLTADSVTHSMFSQKLNDLLNSPRFKQPT